MICSVGAVSGGSDTSYYAFAIARELSSFLIQTREIFLAEMDVGGGTLELSFGEGVTEYSEGMAELCNQGNESSAVISRYFTKHEKQIPGVGVLINSPDPFKARNLTTRADSIVERFLHRPDVYGIADVGSSRHSPPLSILTASDKRIWFMDPALFGVPSKMRFLMNQIKTTAITMIVVPENCESSDKEIADFCQAQHVLRAPHIVANSGSPHQTRGDAKSEKVAKTLSKFVLADDPDKVDDLLASLGVKAKENKAKKEKQMRIHKEKKQKGPKKIKKEDGEKSVKKISALASMKQVISSYRKNEKPGNSPKEKALKPQKQVEKKRKGLKLSRDGEESGTPQSHQIEAEHTGREENE